jgi:phosphoribosylformylglycinamidine synthase
VAVAECCIWSGLGAALRLGVSGSPAIELFGESPSRLVLSCRPRHSAALELLARQFGLHSEVLGTVGGDRLRVELAGHGATGAAEERGSRVADALDVPIADLRHVWDHGLARALGVEHGPGHDPEAAQTVSSGEGA